MRAFATRTGDLSADAAALVLAAGQSLVDGTLADLADVRDAIAAVARRIPRPDLRWWPLALDASLEIAAGRSSRASVAIELAAREGRQANVEIAGPTAMVQQLLLMRQDGGLGSVAGSLEHISVVSASPATISAFGLACVQVGEVGPIEDVAARLAAPGDLLNRAGIQWPYVAMSATEVAFASGHGVLAAQLEDRLAPYAGVGLTLHGVGYFGTVDRCLALLAATRG